MIQFQEVTKQYGQHLVLDHLSLSIEGGEFLTLVGPSGAGKSTLLKALIGATSIDSGSITVDGYEITEFSDDALQEYRRKIGVVFQDYKLLDKKTVYENVAFALEVCGWKEGDIEQRTYEVLDTVGMLDVSGKFPAQLAGGEGQRAAIARAIVHHPRLLIADEPTGNLDFWNAQQILDLLLKVNGRGATVLMATHNRELVDQLNRRVVVLSNGVLVSDKPQGGYEVGLFSIPKRKALLKAMEEAAQREGVGELEIHEIVVE